MAEKIPPPPDPKDFFSADELFELEALSSQTHPRLVDAAQDRLLYLQQYCGQDQQSESPKPKTRIPSFVFGLGIYVSVVSIHERDYSALFLGLAFTFLGAGELALRSDEKYQEKTTINTRQQLVGGYINRLFFNNQSSNHREMA